MWAFFGLKFRIDAYTKYSEHCLFVAHNTNMFTTYTVNNYDTCRD